MTSKKYFPGAHAYGVKPEGAKQLVYEATSSGKPTDVYLHTDTFSWLQEYYHARTRETLQLFKT